MITELEITGFKCFSSLRLSLGGLTLLTGFNAAGKSSAIQPLLLLAQALRLRSMPSLFPLNGPLVRLGSVGDVLPADATTAEIGFRVKSLHGEASWTFSTRAGERFLRTTDHGQTAIPDVLPQRTTEVLVALSTLTFLGAVREGAADSFPAPEGESERRGDVGSDGRYAAFWYDRFVDEAVPESRRHPMEPAGSMRKQLDSWLGSLFPGAQANVQWHPQLSLMSLQFRRSDIGSWQRPANVGYGLTYAFPILVALLCAEDGQSVIIDSPEAHLHPSAQSQMGRLLAHFAAAGVQVVVETHSDHLLNGARLAVRDGIVSHDDVRLHFFSGPRGSQHGVTTPILDAEGRIDEWPEGFFDQSERDLARLAGWG